jgi:uncharacterized protein YbgA (DUF1722 family)/uncharacterized protein YbbK (DUF523 family)
VQRATCNVKRYYEMTDRIRLGISTCLLGEKVRYDGGHKLDRFLVDTLGRYVEYIPVCPEVDCGLTVPREAMHLVGDPDSPRLVTIKTGKDITGQMTRWARRKVLELERKDLSGFIFKSKSPSSGMERVKIYDADGMPSKKGVGIYARIFMDHFPLLPVEEEGRLHDPVIRENFIERVFTLARWRKATAKSRSRATLVDFHTRHKLLILSHNQQRYREMGRLVARAKDAPLAEILEEYQQRLLEVLKFKTTPKKNANVLMHIMGYFKKRLSSDEKKELLDVIQLYRNEFAPLLVPVTLVNHYVRKYREPYLLKQYYLNPHPIELQLRNHV